MAGPRSFNLGLGRSRRTVLRRGTLEFLSRHGVPRALALLVEALPQSPPARFLTGRDADGILALAARALWPAAAVSDHHLDAWVGRGALETLESNRVLDVDLAITADLPGGPFDLVALPFPAGEEALLGRELVEEAHDALGPGARLLASTDGAHHWLLKVVKEVFGHADLQVVTKGRGAVVTARRTDAAGHLRDHSHRFPIERGGRTLWIRTRPGVFSHGRLDSGTKALLGSFEARPGERVLDLGCGAGALGLAAAVDAGPAAVVLVDSNARAADVAAANARENGLEGAQVCLRADLDDLPGGPFDLVLANPPYFSHGRIAESFARRAAGMLAPGGRLLLVAKAIGFHRPILEAQFGETQVAEVAGYGVFRCTRPRRAADSRPRR